MTALANLVRMHRWNLDDKRRKVPELERLLEQLAADLTRVDAEIEAEQDAASRSIEGARVFPAFLTAARRRRKKLADSIIEVEREAERTREEIAEAFQELKKYELALDGRERRRRELLARREQLLLDELGLDMHRRRQLAQGHGD